MSVALEGLGVVWSNGDGLANLARDGRHALNANPLFQTGITDTSALKDRLPLRTLRRTDHFTRMALLAAFQALDNAGCCPADLHHTGIVLSTGYGPARLTFDFLDSILDFGPDMASPLAFAHSVHNIPAATMALLLGISGPCTTICQPDTGVAAALLTARAWLNEERVSRVLLAAVEEQTPLLVENTRRLARGHTSGRGRLAPGDGAVVFCLHADPAKARYGFAQDIFLATTAARQHGPCLFSGTAADATRRTLGATHDFGPVYGNLPTALAFDAALGALAVSGQLAPEMDTPTAVHCLTRDHFGMLGGVTILGSERMDALRPLNQNTP